MRVKEILKYIDKDTQINLVVPDTEASDWGRMWNIAAVYGDYHIRHISPIWDVVAQTPKLKIVVASPAKHGRPKKAEAEAGKKTDKKMNKREEAKS